jgi:hypothetical protein
LSYEGIAQQEGVIFATYSSLIAKSRGGQRQDHRQLHESRIQQLLHWCGVTSSRQSEGLTNQFDGCVLFDECHRAKNFYATNPKKKTKTGVAVYDLQFALPRARIVYCSATGITEPQHMGYMERLGLWGPGTPYQEFKEFFKTIQKPIGAQELMV